MDEIIESTNVLEHGGKRRPIDEDTSGSQFPVPVESMLTTANRNGVVKYVSGWAAYFKSEIDGEV